MSCTSGKLTEEQKRRIEENRRKALEKRASRQVQPRPALSTFATGAATSSYNNNNTSSSSSSSSNSSKYNDARKTNGLGMASLGAQDPNRHVKGGPAPNFYRPSSKTFSTSSLKFQGQSKQQSLLGSAPSWNNSNPKPSTSSSFKTSLDKYAFVKSGKNSTGKQSVASSGGKPVKANCVLVSRSRFSVDVSYQADLIGLFKTIPSRNYNAKTTKWTFALEDYKNFMSAVKLLPSHVSVGPLPKSIVAAFLHSSPGVLKSMPTEELNLNSIDAKLVQALMPFQKEGVSFSIRHDGRVLIADDMGLGKTIQALCVACYYRKEWPLLIVTPSSLRLTWRQAIIKWLPSVDPQFINVVLTGKDSPTSGLINIISYDLLSKFADEIKKKQFRVVIADESHFIKNYKATRTKVAMPVLKSATRVVLLSGTPALSRPCELYTQVTAVQPKLLPSFHEFGLRYCAGAKNHWGWDYSGASNMEELQLLLEEKVLIRRLKKDVLSQLPSKRRQMVMLDPSLIKTRPIQKVAKEVATAEQKEQHGALLRYFFKSCEAKIPAVREYIFDLLEGGHKFLVFAHHKGMLDAISEWLTSKKHNFIRIDGSTPAGVRQSLCDTFQNNSDCVVAVLSITAANTGLTLTAATAVVFAELFWNPGALVQAEDRVYRIGQKNSVNIHYLVAKGTADDYLWPLVQEKLEILNKAGLSGDDFSAADCTSFQDPSQKTLFSYIESFMEDNEQLASLDIEKLASEATSKMQAGNPTNARSKMDNGALNSVTSDAAGDVTDDITSDDASWIDTIDESDPYTPEEPAIRPSCGDDQSLYEPRTKRLRK